MILEVGTGTNQDGVCPVLFCAGDPTATLCGEVQRQLEAAEWRRLNGAPGESIEEWATRLAGDVADAGD